MQARNILKFSSLPPPPHYAPTWHLKGESADTAVLHHLLKQQHSSDILGVVLDPQANAGQEDGLAARLRLDAESHPQHLLQTAQRPDGVRGEGAHPHLVDLVRSQGTQQDGQTLQHRPDRPLGAVTDQNTKTVLLTFTACKI